MSYGSPSSQKTKLAQTSSKKVLVVEDDTVLQPIFRRILESLDPTVTMVWVTTGEEAQKLLESDEDFALVVADHFLAGEKTGFDLWEESMETHHRLPFILMTGRETELMLRKMENGPNTPLFLPKPLRIIDCMEMIEVFIRQKLGAVH